MTSDTPTRLPPMRQSDEAGADMLALAREQGDCLERAANLMLQHVAHSGDSARAGDYIVSFAVENAEGLYHRVRGHLEWQEPEAENCHVEILVRDAADGRFVPGLTVFVTLADEAGREIGTHQQPFLWHPWLYHYGRNWRVPGPGKYSLHVHIDPAEFPRHDRRNGLRFAEPVDVHFSGVEIQPGRK